MLTALSAVRRLHRSGVLSVIVVLESLFSMVGLPFIVGGGGGGPMLS